MDELSEIQKMSDSELKQEYESVQSEKEVIDAKMCKIETELFYRKHPELREFYTNNPGLLPK